MAFVSGGKLVPKAPWFARGLAGAYTVYYAVLLFLTSLVQPNRTLPPANSLREGSRAARGGAGGGGGGDMRRINRPGQSSPSFT